MAFLRATNRGRALQLIDANDYERAPLKVTSGAEDDIDSFFWLDKDCIVFSARGADHKSWIGCAWLSHESGAVTAKVKILARAEEHAGLVGCYSERGSRRVLLTLPSTTRLGSQDLYSVDPKTGARELFHENRDQISVWNVSEDGGTLVGIRGRPAGGSELLAFKSGRRTALLSCVAGEQMDLVGLSRTGQEVYVITDEGSSCDLKRIESISTATRRRTVLAEDPAGEVDVAFSVWNRGHSKLLSVAYFRDRLEYEWFSPAFKTAFEDLCSKLPECDLVLEGCSSDGNKWLLRSIQDSGPSSYLLYDCKEDRLAPLLGSIQSAFDGEQLGKMRPITYLSKDGTKISAYVTIPPYPAARPYPTVVFPHGGPAMRSFWGFDKRVQFFASRGYLVFQPNFRGSSGFGKRFRNSGNGQWGRGVMQDDVGDGLAYLVEQGLADAKRVAIFGGSYGGYSALAGVTFTPNLYAAGISMFGASNLSDFIRDIPPSWSAFVGDLNKQIGNPDNLEDSKRLWWQSPVNYARDVTVPIVIFHGAQDEIIKVSQSENFVRACRANGGEVDFLVSEHGGHGFSDPLDEKAVYLCIEQFLALHLGGSVSENPAQDVVDRLKKLRANAARRLKMLGN